MSRRNYRKRRADSIGYAGSIEDGTLGPDGVLFHGSTSPVYSQDASTKGSASGSLLILQNGALTLGFSGNRRRTPLPPKLGQVIPEKFVYPFRVITTNETLGADRPEFTFPNNQAATSSVLGFSSFSKASSDYNVAWNSGGAFVITGRNPSSVVPQISNYAFRGNTFFSTNSDTFSNITASATPNTNTTQSVVTGTPVEVLEPTLLIGFWQLGPQQFGNFVSSYTNTQQVNRTRTFTPGVSSSASGVTVSAHTQQTIDEYTTGIGSSGSGAPDFCTEPEASLGVLWTGPEGTAPGRNRVSAVNWSVTTNSSPQSGFIFDGAESIQNATETFTQTVAQNNSVSYAPRQWMLTASCVGTGIISFVPRIRFRPQLTDPEVVTAQGTYSNVRSSTGSGTIQVLPDYAIQINNSFQQNELMIIPAYNPLVDFGQENHSITISRSRRSISRGFYDEEAKSCIFSDDLLTSTTNYNSTLQLTSLDVYSVSVDSLTFVPSSVPFGRSATQPSVNNVSAYPTGVIPSGIRTGQRTIVTDTVRTGKGVISGQGEIIFGERLGTVNCNLATAVTDAFFQSATVGNTIVTGGTVFTTRVNTGETLTIPDPGTPTFRDLPTPEEQALNRRFVIQIRSFPSGLYQTLVCTAIALGPNTGTMTATSTTQTHTVTLRIDEIHLNNSHTPLTLDNSIRAARFDHVNDLFPGGITIDRRRWTIRLSSDPAVFWDIWAAFGAVTSKTSTYSKGRLLRSGVLEWDFKPIKGDYVPHSGSSLFLKVNP